MTPQQKLKLLNLQPIETTYYSEFSYSLTENGEKIRLVQKRPSLDEKTKEKERMFFHTSVTLTQQCGSRQDM